VPIDSINKNSQREMELDQLERYLDWMGIYVKEWKQARHQTVQLCSTQNMARR
jgi:hypothetical protein